MEDIDTRINVNNFGVSIIYKLNGVRTLKTYQVKNYIFSLQLIKRIFYRRKGTETAYLRHNFPNFDFGQEQDIFLFSNTSRPAVRPTHPPIQWTTVTLSPAVMRCLRMHETLPPVSLQSFMV